MTHVEKFNTEQQLRDIYYDPVSGFQSKERLSKNKSARSRREQKVCGRMTNVTRCLPRYKPIVRKLPAYRKTLVKKLSGSNTDGSRRYAKI